MHIDRRLLGWGFVFILAGAIPLATGAGLLDHQVVAQWPLLWPVLLIAWGAGLLLRRSTLDWVGGAVAVVTVGAMAGGALTAGFGAIPAASGCGGDGPSSVFASQTGQLTTDAHVNIEFNCGTFRVGAADGNAWTVAGSDQKGQGPAVLAGPSSLSVRPRSTYGLFDAVGRSTWNIAVPRAQRLALGVTLNAGEGTVDLTGAMVSSASLTLNAGDLTVDLARSAQAGDMSMTVNAGSATLSLPGGNRSASFSLNAGSLRVCVPVGTALRVDWSSALGSNNFGSNGLVKVDDDTWTSPSFDPTQAHSELHVSANAGSF